MKYKSMNEAWHGMCKRCLDQGRPDDSRDGKALEIIGQDAEFTLENPDNNVVTNPMRKFSASYACGELLWYLSGSRDASMMVAYAAQYARFAEKDGNAYGAYGHRWRFDPAFVNARGILPNSDVIDSQLDAVLKLLKDKPNSRQCVATMWNAGDIIHAIAGDKKDLPCTLSMQFLLRGSFLHLIVNMRSNDLWLGLPYDAFCFTTIQRLIAHDLGVHCGTYTHRVGSMHIYDRDREKIKAAIKWPVDTMSVYDGRCNVLESVWSKKHCAVAQERQNRIMSIVEISDDAYSAYSLLGRTYNDVILCAASKFKAVDCSRVNHLQLRTCLERTL